MLKQVHTVRCTHIVAQVSMGFYDADGNQVGEEIFPQGESGPLVAKLFHPHTEELASLISTCVDQAWEKLRQCGAADTSPDVAAPEGNGRREAVAEAVS